MNVILLMTFSGSILFLLYLVAERLFRKLFSQQLKYFLLKISLFLHVIPFNFIIYLLKYSLIIDKRLFSSFSIDGIEPVTLISSDQYQYNTAFKINSFIFGIWIIISSFLFLYNIKKFITLKKHLFQIAQEVTSPDILEMKNKYQLQLNIKQKIRIFSVNDNITPFTFGILNPIVLLPQPEKLSNFELDSAIYHELYHIKCKDEFILLIRTLVAEIYWFNPLIYLLNSKLSKSCELACDEFIVKSWNINKRKKYASFLVHLAEKNTTIYQKSVIALANNNNLIKERVKFIMDEKNPKIRMAILLSVLFILFSLIPSFLYNPIQKLEYLTDNHATLYMSSSKDYITYSNVNLEEGNDTITVIYYDNQFIDIYGTVSDAADLLNYKYCEHLFIDGVFSSHCRNLNGGCTLDSYHAQRCFNCGWIKLDSFIHKVEDTVCLHKS